MQRFTLAHLNEPAIQLSMQREDDTDALTLAWRRKGDSVDGWRCEMAVSSAAIPKLVATLRKGSPTANEITLARTTTQKIVYWAQRESPDRVYHFFSFSETVTKGNQSAPNTELVLLGSKEALRLANYITASCDDDVNGPPPPRAKFGLYLQV